MARPDFRAAAARRLSEERELSPAIVSLLSADPSRHSTGVRVVPLDRIEPNPDQPRLAFDETTLAELAASIREHGVLQPILVRPLDGGRFQLIAGERRWRASKLAGQPTIPALVEEIDDETALEISIIENLQREDLSPLDEAAMYDRMIRQHGYSIRKLADKLGKDKGYLENRLRLADAPDDVRELVSLRKDTLSHAYELLKVPDARRRRRLAQQVARGELSLVKLRDRVEGRRRSPVPDAPDGSTETPAPVAMPEPVLPVAPAAVKGIADDGEWVERRAASRQRGTRDDNALLDAKRGFAESIEGLLDVLRDPVVLQSIGSVDRANLVKYLTIARIRLENAITVIRTGDPDA